MASSLAAEPKGASHDSNPPDSSTRGAGWAWAILGYTVFVILFGAVVRITGSGAGCGQHWPTCNGEVAHLPRSIETLIELTHRLTSGLSLVFAFGLIALSRRRFAAGHVARRAAWLGLAFLLVEALIGAGLVMFELVADDDSVARAVVMAIHLSNTSLLTGAMALTVWAWHPTPPRLSLRGVRAVVLGLALLAVILISMSGAVTALGDTLYPVAERSGEPRHFLEQTRIVHPVLAILLSAYVWWAVSKCARGAPTPMASAVKGALLFQLFLGAANVWLSAPGWMQLMHLASAKGVWIVLLLFTFGVLSAQIESTINP
jgi:heme A synthase